MISKLRLKKYKILYLKKKFFIWKKTFRKKPHLKRKSVIVKKNNSEFYINSNVLKHYAFFKFLVRLKPDYFSSNIFTSLNIFKKLVLRVFKNGKKLNFCAIIFKAIFYISKKFFLPLKVILLFILSKLENPVILKIFFLRKSKILMPVPSLGLNKSLREGISWFKKSLKSRRERTVYLRVVSEFSELLSNKGLILAEKKKYISNILLSAAQNRRYQKFLLKNVI